MNHQVVKAIAAIKAAGTDSGDFEVILSTPTVDRDGEQVKAEEWEALPDHITFDVDHGMSVTTTVGSGVPTLDEQGRLVVRGSFASTPLAQTTRTLVTEKHIRTTSVAFLRKHLVVDGEQVVRRELLNGAFVAVPANPEAVVLTSKTLNPDDPVAAAKAVKGAATKAIAGSYEERQGAVYRAVDRLYEGDWDTWAYLVGTDETTAVWRAHSRDEAKDGTWRADYTIDDAFVVTLGEPVKVRVVEVVVELPETTAPAPAAVKTLPLPAGAEEVATKEAGEQAAALTALLERRLAALNAGVL